MWQERTRHITIVPMDDPTDDGVLVGMITDIAADVVEKLGQDGEARFQFFKAFVELAKRTVAKLN